LLVDLASLDDEDNDGHFSPMTMKANYKFKIACRFSKLDLQEEEDWQDIKFLK
jgi:hypothetical protein